MLLQVQVYSRCRKSMVSYTHMSMVQWLHLCSQSSLIIYMQCLVTKMQYVFGTFTCEFEESLKYFTTLHVITCFYCTEVPSAAVCQMISSDHGIASQWTKLARLLGLNRSQIDEIRLECHGRPQPCQLSADRVLTSWSTSGGTAHSCSLATLLRVLQYMDQGLVLSKVVEYLQASSASWGELHCFRSA